MVTVALMTHLFPTKQAPLRGSFVVEQAQALTRAGVAVRVVAAAYESCPETPDRLEGLSVTYVRLPWVRWLGGLGNMALVPAFYVPRALRAIRAMDSRPDLIHAHFGYPDGAVGVILRGRLRIPLVVTLHGSDVDHQMMRPLVGSTIASILGHADLLITVSREMAAKVAAKIPRARAV